MDVVDNTEMRHFEVKVGERLAIIEYQVQERKYFLTRTDFPDKFKEDGRSEQMIEEVLKLIDETGMRVVPMTRPIKQFFRDHSKYKKMLPVGIHL